MILHIKNMVCDRCIMVVRQQLQNIGLDVSEVNLNSAVGLNCALHKDNDCSDEATEHYQKPSFQNQHDHQSLTVIAQEDPCCQNAVNNFNTLAKVVPQSSHVILLAPITYIGTYYQFLLKPVSDSQVNYSVPLDERRRPPTYPIRIVIQSFQI